MYKALTAEQTGAAERAAVAAGHSLQALMDAAGESVAREVASRVPAGDVCIVCGPGNNGGDGWVAARVLHAAGRRVRVVSLVEPAELSGPAHEAAATAASAGVRYEVSVEPSTTTALRGSACVVDALLGTGARLPLSESLTRWCEAVSNSGAYVVAVDLPTGCDSDSGACSQAAVTAGCTVTFATVKRGLVLYPAAARAGDVVVADIGIPPSAWRDAAAPEVWTHEEYGALVPLPEVDTHKNRRGRVLVVAGSSRFPGAAVLACRGAMRMGAGYVTLAVPAPILTVAQSHLLAAPVVGLPAAGGSLSSAAGAVVADLAREYDAVVVGPGLTVADGTVTAVRHMAAVIEQPMVLDADAINAFVDNAEAIRSRRGATVLTPHPGELGRLLGVAAEAIHRDRVSSSAELAGERRCVLLKGPATVISTAFRQVINTSGTPGLATAGTGDVLAGMVGALLAQGLGMLEAGALGAYVHGRAGEAAAQELTTVCMTAEDMVDYLPVAVAELLGAG